MSTPTVSGYKNLTQADINKIRSTATATRQFSLGATIPITQREGVTAAYKALNTADKQKLLSALVTVAKNFVIGGTTELNDRKKAGGSTDEGYKRRNTVWKDHVAFVKVFIQSATRNGVVPSWDSIILNLLDDLKFEIYASYDNLYAPRFVAQTKLASYIEETEFVQIYQIRTAAARKLASMTPYTWEGSTETYAPILGDYANLVQLVRAGDVKTCFLLSAIVDYMARYRYYKTQRNQDLRNKFEQEAVYELTETGKAFGIVFSGKETRREARIMLSDALTKKKQYFVKKADNYTPFDAKARTLADIGTSKPTLDDFIADFTDKAKTDKKDTGIPMSGTGSGKPVDKPVDVKVFDLLKDAIPSTPTPTPSDDSDKVITFDPNMVKSLWMAMIATLEVDSWIGDISIQKAERGVRYKIDLSDIAPTVPEAKSQIDVSNYKGYMKWLHNTPDFTTTVAQQVGVALTKMDLIKHSGLFTGSSFRFNNKNIPTGGWADTTDAKQLGAAKELLSNIDTVFGDSTLMRHKTTNEDNMPLKSDARIVLFTAWTSLDRGFVNNPGALTVNNSMSYIRRKILDYVPASTIGSKMSEIRIKGIYST